MAKLTNDQKRKKKLKHRKSVSVKTRVPKPQTNMETRKLAYFHIDENGVKSEKMYDVKVEKATLLYCEERMCNGKVLQIEPDKNLEIVAWDYFGVAACNFIHPGVEECNGLRTFITPNEIKGLVVAFPDWVKDKFFDTSSFLLFTEGNSEFNFNDLEEIKKIEDYVNSDILPIIADHSHVTSIDPTFIFRSYSLFKAFDKYWCAALFVSKGKAKKFENKVNKKIFKQDFLNRKSVKEILVKH